ncbi:methylmalonyl Co-A mutase-associated GTPase MeaB [Gephyromycinifex aptenodytis]|uniref:methylmalonyl Co-A mutase-associated GTPase MeaB n=1 Tax=Gephyromycinifex aptenodytis TaxID=2716227 RepID=UPI001446F3E0|nr:methylmalonyl Co-A mutase-associated GTPase MeaB [Gephyromycinifex aptenodytis]
MRRGLDVDALEKGVREGSRSVLARAITVLESSRLDHRKQAHELLARLEPDTGAALRVGISGVPGAGKSTFIDELGTRLIEKGHRVAVLAVDPSSSRTGGSILGDRTRMARLAESQDAFIRPSPSGCHLGGVARATREAMVVVEAAGFDVVLVETVGVGQSEVAVSDMVDTFLLLALARSGDQLQGIKRGILERADVIGVNKADGEHAREARIAARELSSAMRLMMGSDEKRRKPTVFTCSAVTGDGLDDIWNAVLAHRQDLEDSGKLAPRRAAQQLEWMWTMVDTRLQDAVRRTEGVRKVRAELEKRVSAGELSALDASEEVLAIFGREATEMLAIGA